LDTTSPHEAQPAERSRWAAVRAGLGRVHILILPLIFFMVAFTFMNDRFLTSTNLLNVARAAAVTTVIGVGMTFLITSRNLDLSVGSILGLTMATAGTALKWFGMPVPVAILIALFGGALLGLVNGLVVTRL
jgi:ribose/xylose/arabinose/galactoside ABC-type transport system permease subunit